jgi:chromosome segregation ATPase
MERQNEQQLRTIKKLENEIEELKASLHKWQDSKNKYQMDLESKSRVIFNLERDNKCLAEEVEKIRRYRTMETVEQVIITKLKEEIMGLNKRMIEMQA